MKRILCLSLLLQFVPVGAAPQDLAFHRVWTGREAFAGELPFPADVSFLPMAQYQAEVSALPAGLRIASPDGVLMSFTAPTNVAPPYVMRLSLTGNSLPAVFVTKDGRTDYAYALKVPAGLDLRRRELMTTARVESFGGAGPVRAVLSDGAGRADIRFVTRGREGKPYFENGRLFYTFSARHYGAYMGVGSLDPRHPEAGVRFEGVIAFDYGDGLIRNDLAAHLFYDEEADEWRGWSSNFSTGSDGLSGRAPGGLNAVWSKTSPLHGFNVMHAQSLGLTGMNEDPCGVWDADAKKWRLLVSEFAEKDIRASLLESDDWKGPFTRLAGPVPENATGTTLVSICGTRYALAGSSQGFFRVFTYPTLERIGALHLDPEPWGQTPLETPWGVRTTKNARDWPSVVELPEDCPHRYLLLTMDRVNIPGIPDPNWTYGGLHLYVADETVTIDDFVASDPFIYRDDAAGLYRMYLLDRPGVQMRTSRDLVNWSMPKRVLTVPEELGCANVWAPEMHAYKGKYYLFVTINTKRGTFPELPLMADNGWQTPKDVGRRRRGTWIFRADSPEGPFESWSDGPIPPADWSTLDGTLWVEDGKPYMVFCHEWVQVRDGRMVAVELTPDLKAAAGEPFELFRASSRPDAPKESWRSHVTDGPWLFRSSSGELMMTWSSGSPTGYAVYVTRSLSGRLAGPWGPHEKISGIKDGGHGMLFEGFDGKRRFVYHQPNAPEARKRAKILLHQDGAGFSEGAH